MAGQSSARAGTSTPGKTLARAVIFLLPGKQSRWQGNRLPGRGPVRQVKHRWRMRTLLLPGKLPRWQGNRLPRQELNARYM